MFQVDQQDRYTLMHKDTAVCTFSYNLRRRSVCDLEALRPDMAPWGASTSQGVIDPVQLGWWISYRYIPTGRAGLSDILRSAGCADPASLLFKTLALNLSDQYWIRPANLAVSWGEVNYFDNPYVDGHTVWTAADGVHVRMGPGSATSGQLAKHWESRDGRNVLVKGSSGADCHEPWAEELASGLCSVLMPAGAWLPYRVEERDGLPVSVCACFANAGTEFVPLDDVMRHFDPPQHTSLFDTYAETLEQLGIPEARSSLERELVLDYLIANDDRHEFNLGVMLGSDSRKPLRCAPVFDNGRGFYLGAHCAEELTRGLYPYDARVFDNGGANSLGHVSDFSWIDFDALRAFAPAVKELLAQTRHPAWFAPAAKTQYLLRVAELESFALRGE